MDIILHENEHIQKLHYQISNPMECHTSMSLQCGLSCVVNFVKASYHNEISYVNRYVLEQR